MSRAFPWAVSKADSAKWTGWIPVAIVAIVIVTGVPARAQNILFKTELSQTTLVADGETPYTLNVTVDTRNLPAVQFAYWSWKLTAPTGIRFIGSAMPASNDFFAGFAMEDGLDYVSATSDNDRAVAIPWTSGPSNRYGILGTYTFVADSNAPLGIGSFSTQSVYGYGINYAEYSTSNAVVTQNTSFTVATEAPEPSAMVLLAGGLLALHSRPRRQRR